jgi:hypothetical protein
LPSHFPRVGNNTVSIYIGQTNTHKIIITQRIYEGTRYVIYYIKTSYSKPFRVVF